LSLRSEIEQLHAFAREGIDPARIGSAQDSATVAAELAVTEIVDEEVDDVGRTARGRPLLLLRRLS
jgi:hypothetical protein